MLRINNKLTETHDSYRTGNIVISTLNGLFVNILNITYISKIYDFPLKMGNSPALNSFVFGYLVFSFLMLFILTAS